MTNQRNDQKHPTNQGGQKTPTDSWNKDKTSKDPNQEVDYPDKKEKGIDPMHRPYIVGDDEDTDTKAIVDENQNEVDDTDTDHQTGDDTNRNGTTNRESSGNPDQNN